MNGSDFSEASLYSSKSKSARS